MVFLRNAPARRAFLAGSSSCLFFAVALAGCGGGGNGSTGAASTRSAPVNVYVTDGLTDKYSQVLVTLYGIDVSTDGGSTWTSVYTDATGAAIDLASLSQSAQLLSSVTLPTGTITNVRLTFNDSVSLVPTGSGTTQTVTVPAAPNIVISGDNAVVTYATSTKLTAAKLANIVVDFNLAAFELTGNSLKPAIGPCDPTAFNNKQKMAYIPGTVSNLAAGTSFTLSLARPNGSGSSSLTVDLSSTTTVSSAPGSSTAAATLANGDSVLVSGPVDQTTGVLTAQSILIAPAQTATPSPAPISGSPTNISAIGTVQSVDATTGNLVVRIHQGEHFPHAMGGLTVATSSSTVFQSGQSTVSLSSITTGISVAIVGSLDPASGIVTATNIILLPAMSGVPPVPTVEPAQ